MWRTTQATSNTAMRPKAACGTVQHIAIRSMSDAPLVLVPENFGMFMQAIRKNVQGMEDAELTGLHGTSEKRARGIIKNRPGLALCGQNRGDGWSQTNDVFHVAWQASIALESAEKAAQKMDALCSCRGPAKAQHRAAAACFVVGA